MIAQTNRQRRRVLRAIVAGSCGLAFLSSSIAAPALRRESGPKHFRPHLWLSIDTSGRIELVVRKVEMGQGIHTALRAIVARELAVDSAFVAVVQSTSDPKYGQLVTGGSFSVAGQYEPLRRVAALARTLLVDAAAKRWGVSSEACDTADARVRCGDHSAAYAELVPAAVAQPVPKLESVSLRPSSTDDSPLDATPPLYHAECLDGSAQYGVDFRLPGMLYASIERAPSVGATIKRVDARAALQVPGVTRVETLAGNAWPSLNHVRAGVAVLAENHWSAQQARKQLIIEWEQSLASRQDSDATRREMMERAARPGLICRREGSFEAAATAKPQLAATYSLPYLAHAQLEPLNATARVSRGRVEVWTGTQRQRRLHDALVREFSARENDVIVHTPLLGGGFGRRLEIDYGLEAALLAARTKRPVQVLWTRADELRAGLFRPASAHRLDAWVNGEGSLVALGHHVVSESVLLQQEPEQIAPDGSDWTMTITLMTYFYAVPNLLFSHTPMKPTLPCAWWRGTGATQVHVVTECFMDELALAAGRDPLEYRLAHLPANYRRTFTISKGNEAEFDAALMRRALTECARRASWPRASKPGRALGIACGFYDCPATYTAAIAEMEQDGDGSARVTKITIATDAGRIIDGSGARAQLESNAVFALGAALYQEIVVKNGEVQANNFDGFAVPRINEIPAIDCILLDSNRDPSGLGEPATPVVMAAVANAHARLTNRRSQRFPILGPEN